VEPGLTTGHFCILDQLEFVPGPAVHEFQIILLAVTAGTLSLAVCAEVDVK